MAITTRRTDAFFSKTQRHHRTESVGLGLKISTSTANANLKPPDYKHVTNNCSGGTIKLDISGKLRDMPTSGHVLRRLS
jgi:hypothetical protein